LSLGVYSRGNNSWISEVSTTRALNSSTFASVQDSLAILCRRELFVSMTLFDRGGNGGGGDKAVSLADERVAIPKSKSKVHAVVYVLATTIIDRPFQLRLVYAICVSEGSSPTGRFRSFASRWYPCDSYTFLNAQVYL
jgi:hypothetical protein